MQLLVGSDQLIAHRPLLNLHLSQSIAKLLGCQSTVGGKIYKTFLLSIELLDLLAEPSMLLLLIGEQVPKSQVYVVLCFGNGLVAERQSGKLFADGVGNLGGRKVWEVAHTVLSPATEEILIDLTGVVLGLGIDEPMTPSLMVTTAAMHQSPQKMVVDNVALAASQSGIDDLLDSPAAVLETA